MRKRSEFERIQKGGARVHTERFVLILARQDEPCGPARLGVTASRRIGGAVVRNRAKRLVRAAFRATSELFAPGLDLVVIVRRALDGARLGDIVSEWRSARGSLERRAQALLAETPDRANTRPT